MYVRIGQTGIALLCVGMASCVAAAQHRISFEPRKDTVRVLVDGGPLATYVWRDAEILRPYFKDLHAPGGIQVTRPCPPQKGTDPVDYETMHPGLWLAFGDLSGADFWRNYGGWVDDKFVGITIMPDPDNAVACRWHVRDYGFMAANPFGGSVFKQGPVRRTEVKPGQSLRLRFGILIHAGEGEGTVQLTSAYQDYLQIRTQESKLK